MVTTAPAPGFDTLTYARRLKAAGVDEAQAEAHAEAVRDAITEGSATKADIARLEAKIDTIADKLMLRLGGLVIAVGGLIVAAIKLLP